MTLAHWLLSDRRSAAGLPVRRWVHQANYWFYTESGTELHFQLPAKARVQAVAVVGQPGVGKSRLCHEFVERSRRSPEEFPRLADGWFLHGDLRPVENRRTHDLGWSGFLSQDHHPQRGAQGREDYDQIATL